MVILVILRSYCTQFRIKLFNIVSLISAEKLEKSQLLILAKSKKCIEYVCAVPYVIITKI